MIIEASAFLVILQNGVVPAACPNRAMTSDVARHGQRTAVRSKHEWDSCGPLACVRHRGAAAATQVLSSS